MTIKKSDLERYIELAKDFICLVRADTIWDELYTLRRVVFGNDTWLH